VRRCCVVPSLRTPEQQKRDAVRTLLVEIDIILAMLMGAVDASARFIHVLLAWGQLRDVGWQKLGSLSKLTRQSQPGLISSAPARSGPHAGVGPVRPRPARVCGIMGNHGGIVRA
jgi:hypothetical protein